MDVSADYYATLAIVPEADASAIRRAYRDLMRRYHPDVNATAEAAAKAQAINEAYACLRDPDERAAYDRLRHAARTAEPMTPPPPRRSHASHWRHQHTYIVEDDLPVQPKKWKAASLGAATLLTVVTFALTSATPPPMPLPPEPVMVMTTGMAGPAVYGGCKARGAAPDAPCPNAPARTPEPTAR